MALAGRHAQTVRLDTGTLFDVCIIPVIVYKCSAVLRGEDCISELRNFIIRQR